MNKMTVAQLEYANILNNENKQKILEKLVNETDNASFVSMFEDNSAILFDHEEGNFYVSDFQVNEDNLQVTFKNFEKIEIVKEKNLLSEAVYNFFDEDDEDVMKLAEAYSSYYKQDYYVSELISKAMSKKDFSNIIDYSSIVESEKVDIEGLMEEDWFVSYQNRLDDKPMTEIKHLNWNKDSVSVSLLESEKVKKVTENKFERAQDLWKVEKFRKAIVEASSAFVNDVEEGTSLFAEAISQFPEFALLDGSEKKEIIAKTILFDGKLKTSAKQITEGFTAKLKDGTFDLILEEAEEALADAGETGDDKEDDKPASLTPDQIRKLKQELEKIADECEDEKLSDKIEAVIKKLEESAEQNYTDVFAVREAVSLITL